MPKQPKNSVHPRYSPVSAAPLQRPMSAISQQHHRVAAIWNSSDDETLLAARATGLNWQPIAIQHFPNKTANACRKRHERLMEKKRHEDWDSRKLDVLATAYMECRKEIWSIVAARIGEPWAIVEAKVRYTTTADDTRSLLVRSAWKKALQICKLSHGSHKKTRHRATAVMTKVTKRTMKATRASAVPRLRWTQVALVG